MDRHLSSRSAASSTDLRRKKMLLYAIRQQEIACWRVTDFSTLIHDSLLSDKSISVLVCKHQDAELRSTADEEVRLSIYENESYEPHERRISSLVDLVIGFSFLPLTLSMVEDYGYPLSRLMRNEGVFLVLIFIFCVTLSCLYLLSTYPIYHGMMNKGMDLIRDPREAILSFCRRSPLFVLSSIVALSRTNASYSIFGSIIGRMEVPEGMGLTLVWFGVITVAVVDFSATLKIASRAVKYIWMIALMELGRWTETGIGWIDSEIRRSVVRHHSKRLKRCIRNSDEYDLSCFVGQLL
jgi:hypothetical protein